MPSGTVPAWAAAPRRGFQRAAANIFASSSASIRSSGPEGKVDVPKLAGDLGPLERAIMDHIWDRPDDEVSVRDVLTTVAGRRLAYTTVMTVLERLWRKGFLSRRHVGRAYVYRGRITREAHIEHLVTQVLARAPDRGSAILGFVRGVDEDDLVELRKAIRRVERERRSDR